MNEDARSSKDGAGLRHVLFVPMGASLSKSTFIGYNPPQLSRSGENTSSVPTSLRMPFGAREDPTGSEPTKSLEGGLETFQAVQDVVCKLRAHRGTLEVASLLYLCGPCTGYEVRKSVRVRQRALYGSLKVLLDLKWIEVERVYSFPRTRTKTYVLSARGRAWIEPLVKGWLPLLGNRGLV